MAFPTGAVGGGSRSWPRRSAAGWGGERGPDHPPTRPAEPSGGARRRAAADAVGDDPTGAGGGAVVPRGRRRRGGRLAGRADRPPVVGRRWAPVRGTRRPDLAGQPAWSPTPGACGTRVDVGGRAPRRRGRHPSRVSGLGSAALRDARGSRSPRRRSRWPSRRCWGRRRHGPAVVRADPPPGGAGGPRSSGWPPAPLPASAWGCWSCGSTPARTAPGPTPLALLDDEADRTAGSSVDELPGRGRAAEPARPSWRRSAWAPAPAWRGSHDTAYLWAATGRAVPRHRMRSAGRRADRATAARPVGVAGPCGGGPLSAGGGCEPRSPGRT